MSLQALVVTSEPGKGKKVKLDDRELVEVLGDQDKEIAVRIDEIVKAVTDTLRSSLSTEADLTIELTGSVSLTAQAGVKWMFFNVGGKSTTSDALKVVLKTKLAPAKSVASKDAK